MKRTRASPSVGQPDRETAVAVAPPTAATAAVLDDSAEAIRTVLAEVNERLLLSIIQAQSTMEMQAEQLQGVRRNAEIDTLTDLPNRVLLADRFAQAVANAQRHRGRLAVLFLDIDKFKEINDRGGHAAGDLALKSAARRLLSAVRAGDTVSRIGGDEFVLLITEVASPSYAGLIAAKIVAALAVADAGGPGLATSIGISLYPEDGVDLEALVVHADAAMYRAKQAGGGRYAHHVTGIDRKSVPPPQATLFPVRGVDAVPAPPAEHERVDADLRETNEWLVLTALRESDDRARTDTLLQLALDAAEMGNWEVDIATGLVTCSPRCDRILGHVDSFPEHDLEAIVRRFVPEDRAAVADAFRRAPLDGSLDFERRIDRSDGGGIRWLHFTGRSYAEPTAPVRIAGVVTDVTARRAGDDRLREAQTVEAVGQLIGGIAHAFNNLLLVIGGSLDLLAQRLPPDPRTDHVLHAARRSVARGAKLNTQLLAFARRQGLRPEVFSVAGRRATFADLLRRVVADAAITVDVVCEPLLWNCLADAARLDAAVHDLAVNARDAMPDGGRLTLRAGNCTTSEAFARRWSASAGDYVAISVEDTGSGMSPAVSARCFEPFFTTKSVRGGTGLGLSQVYGFARQSDGFVSLEPAAAGGTVVTIHLPRARDLPS